MEERVARMETTLDRHDSQITKLFSRVDETNKIIKQNKALKRELTTLKKQFNDSKKKVKKKNTDKKLG